jgi:uncharacterized protein (DUF2336 family)
MERIIEDFRGEEEVMQTLINARQLPLTLVEKLIANASKAIGDQLKAKYGLSDEQLTKDTAAVQEDIMLKLLTPDIAEKDIEALMAQLVQNGRLTPSLVMTALCRGQELFFAHALARFADVKAENAKRLISDRGEFGFRGLYAKCSLPDMMFDAVRLVLRSVQSLEGDEAVPGSMLYANRLAERVLAAAGDRSIEYLPYFIALIRQNIGRH